jgi:hypothetical protein
MYASERCNKSMCEQVIRDAHDKRITSIKAGETYALSIKTGQPGWNCGASLSR